MPSVYAVARQFRRQVLEADQEVRTELLKAYAESWSLLKASLEDVTGLIANARQSGERITPGWLARQERYQTLLGQVSQEVARIANLGAITLPREQTEMVHLAQAHARELVRAQTAGAAQDVGVAASFNRLNPDAVENMVGFLSDGSPLRSLLDELGPEAGKNVADALKRSVILGESPRATATRTKDAFGGSLVRSLRVARTELLRTYREASHQTYQANADLLSGWQWHASLSRYTCSSCIALHGRIFPIEERMREHINGRCTQIPIVRGEPSPTEKTGEEWFAEQDEDTQAFMLGKAAHREYAVGNVALSDFIGATRSTKWGPNYQERSLRDALAHRGEPLIRFTPKAPSTPPVAPVAPPPPPVKWGEFSTLEEAQREAAKRFPGINFDFTGAHVDTINPTLRQFASLAEEYPQVAERLKYVGTYQGKGAPLSPASAWSGSGTNAYAHASRDGTRIGLNPHWYGKPQFIRASLKSAGETGWHPKGIDSIESVMTHEFGHQVAHWLESVSNKFAAQRFILADGSGWVSSTARNWIRHHKVPRSYSVYGVTNHDESWAEAFAGQYHGTPQQKNLTYLKKQRALLDALKPEKWLPEGEWKTLYQLPQEQRGAAFEEVQKWLKTFN